MAKITKPNKIAEITKIAKAKQSNLDKLFHWQNGRNRRNALILFRVESAV